METALRPIDKGPSPGTPPLDQDKSKELLRERLGDYCSFCECRVTQLMELEHKVPQNLAVKGHVTWAEIDCWENYTLACKSCNLCKSGTDTRPLGAYLWPDSDNPLCFLTYDRDQALVPLPNLTPEAHKRVLRTIQLLGLDRDDRSPKRATSKDKRYVLRRSAWRASEELIQLTKDYPGIETQPSGRASIQRLVLEMGFFSVFYTAFKNHPHLRQIVLDAFPGTARSCFHPQTGEPIARP